MKIRVIDPQEVIYSSETRQVKIEYDGQEYIIRQFEDDNGGENSVFINNSWKEPSQIKAENPGLAKIVTCVCNYIREGIFDEKAEVDLTEWLASDEEMGL
jgi:hypothetical protein